MSRDRGVAIAILVVVAALFLGLGWSRISAPFGDSDEGVNGSVWGAASRAVRVDGPVASRLGGIRSDRTKYATHPPLIVVETAVLESVVGEHPWSTRAPAWLGSLAALPLLYLLLRELGPSPVAAASATAATALCHMLFTYGVMLDTMIIAVPFVLATTRVWYRQWTGRARWPWPATLALATVTALSGWQAVFLVGLCGVAAAARARTRGRAAVAEALPYLAASAVGAIVTVAWAVWVYGSLAVLDEKLGQRTGGATVGVGEMLSFQLPWLSLLLGLGLVAWVACALSLRDDDFRPVAALFLAATLIYPLIVKQGSAGHQYWNYWGLLPTAVGWGYVASRLGGAVPAVVLVVGAAAIGVANLAQPDRAGEDIDAGVRAYEAVDHALLAPGQETIPYLGEPYRMDDWLRYRAGPPGEPILNADQLRQLARARPDTVVVVLGSCKDPDPTVVCEQITYPPGTRRDRLPVRLATAAELVAQLPTS